MTHAGWIGVDTSIRVTHVACSCDEATPAQTREGTVVNIEGDTLIVVFTDDEDEDEEYGLEWQPDGTYRESNDASHVLTVEPVELL